MMAFSWHSSLSSVQKGAGAATACNQYVTGVHSLAFHNDTLNQLHQRAKSSEMVPCCVGYESG